MNIFLIFEDGKLFRKTNCGEKAKDFVKYWNANSSSHYQKMSLDKVIDLDDYDPYVFMCEEDKK